MTHICKLEKRVQGTRDEKSILEGCYATYQIKFNVDVNELGDEVPQVAEDFLSKGVHHFYKAFISIILKSDNVDNNIAETFNGYIYKARTMSII